MKILIAEDQAPSAFYLCRTLEKMGHETTVAPDGEQAWQILQSGAAASVDLGLDDAARGRPGALPAHPVVGRGAIHLHHPFDLARSKGRPPRRPARGADDFLTKPPDPDELAVRLEIAERILKVHAQLARQNERLVELAAVDELTGTKNRRRFREDLDLLYRASPAPGLALVADHARSRSFQGIQRHLRPSGGRRDPAAGWARPCDRHFAATTWWRGTAARSLSCCCRRRPSTKRSRLPSGCAARSRAVHGRAGRSPPAWESEPSAPARRARRHSLNRPTGRCIARKRRVEIG